MQTPMTLCRLISTWHEWNANDIMMMWFALYVNPSDITSCMHDVHMCMVQVLYVLLAHLSIQVA